eukprot:g5875.t1
MMAANSPRPPGTEKNLGSYYRRPSAAIERGGGFFVPGLEGFRLRFVLAAVILGLLSLDGFSRPGMTTSQVVSESLAGLAGFVLFAQALLDQQKERAVEMRREAIAASPASAGGDDAGPAGEGGKIAFVDSAALGADLEGKVRWAADIVLQLTAACSFVAFSDGKVLARVGDTGGESDDRGVVAAAFEQAASRAAATTGAAAAGAQAEDAPPSAIIVKKRGSDSDNRQGEDALMRLLPSSCRQGVLCRFPAPTPGGGDARDMVVLLGSTLAGSGVFSGMDGAWFERVCACLSLGSAGAAAKATAEAGGR